MFAKHDKYEVKSTVLSLSLCAARTQAAGGTRGH